MKKRLGLSFTPLALRSEPGNLVTPYDPKGKPVTRKVHKQAERKRQEIE